MPIYIITILVQIALVIHIFKTNRNRSWIFLVIALPLIGSIVYFVIEILPDMIGSRTGRSATRRLEKLVNPNKEFKEASENYSVIDTVENTVKLAEQYIDMNMFKEAKELFQKCLSGIHKDDPDLMFGIAKSEFGLKNFSESKKILDSIIELNPDYKNPNAHLLYARTLENLQDYELALEEYKVLDTYYLGAEATYRYGKLLKQLGNTELSDACFDKIIKASKISGKHYNTLNKEWVSKTKAEHQQ